LEFLEVNIRLNSRVIRKYSPSKELKQSGCKIEGGAKKYSWESVIQL